MKSCYQLFCFFLCWVSLPIGYAQNISEHVVLSVGTPFSYPLDQTVNWCITELTSGKVLRNGSGPIRRLLFEIPGTYQIDIEEELGYDPTTCNHPRYPAEITIEVSPFHMEFDFTTIRLSREIIGGQAVDGQTLSVDVAFRAYRSDTVAYEVQPVKSVGIGTTIVGVPLQERMVFRPGVNTIVYQLHGQAHSSSYIMFDFIDINNQVQVYSLPQKIK